MATLADRIRAISDLTQEQAEHLRTFCSSWQVLADLSFSDLLLYVPLSSSAAIGDELFVISAQLRPFTSQTLYPHDMVGTRVSQPEQPIVERAFREGRVWAQADPVLVDGIPIRMDAVPVRFRDRVIAVVSKEGSPATSRRPGRLEQVYLQAAESVSSMISDGTFPYEDTPRTDWPRVGDGLLMLDGSGCVQWASPNAVSAFSGLGAGGNLLGKDLDEISLGTGLGSTMFSSQTLVDGEISRRDNHILLRGLPFLEGDRVTGGVVLARDVSELRRKERVISVKDATIREIHHRVKNNLQTIASLLRLQARRLTSEEAKAALQESVLRVGSIALVHETLSEDPQDVAEFGEVARRISSMVTEGLVLPDHRVDIKVTGETGRMTAEIATPLAVTVTELIQNAIEHAFPDDRSGTISIELSRNGDDIRVVVRDDGVGIPDEIPGGSRLGLQIVRTLIEELGGRFSVTAEGGTVAEVTIPTARS